jgi:tetratricopeptide (TPR) repeat protein
MTWRQPPLSLVYDADPARAAGAFFIPGADAQVWLDEIGRWGVAFDGVRICLVPRSASDRRPCGVLAIVTGGESAVIPSPLVQPYGRLVERLYLPADARLHPPMSDAELVDALLYPLQVFHPAIGLVGYRDEDLMLATDLIAPPQLVEHDWDRADPGLPPAPPLRVVLPSVTPNVATIVEDFRDDIGSAAGEDLPPLPEESTIRGLASKSALGMLGALSWLASHLPGGGESSLYKGGSDKGAASSSSGHEGAAGGDWRRRLQRWSKSMSESLRQSLARARHKELARLLDLLERNVDEALRYALPLRGTPGRGVARPRARLSARNPEFDPRSVGRARPVDAWDASAFEVQLAAKYRLAANRELGLGRYRRAAYIFAQLLGDFGAAANALRQGRFYREAATLYRDQLKDAGAAAECLEAGGLLLEAVPLYEELGRHEKVGDLYATLERPDDAREHYRRAVGEFVGRADLLAAARLLETKLTSPDEALATLESGWPQSHRAGECMRGVFELLGRLGRHEAALARLARLRPETREGELALVLAEVLGRVAARYPNADLRMRAADAARVVVGNRLSAGRGCGASELRTLVNVVMRLAPEDRLLARDANRYQSRPPALPAPPPPPRPPRKRATEPTLVRAFHLGAHAHPKTVHPDGDHFYAIAVRGEQLLFVRGRWDGSVRETERRDPLAINTHYRIQRAGARSAITFAIPLRRAGALPPADGGPDSSYPASYLQQPPDARSGVIYDMSVDEHNVLWSLRESAGAAALILYAHDPAGRLLSSRSLDCAANPGLFTSPTALVARAGIAYVLCGNAIHCFDGDRQWDINLHRPAADLLVSHPHVRPRLVVTFAEGGVVIFPEDGHAVRFGEGLFDPVACFTRGGTLVVIGRGRGMTCRVERTGIQGVSPFEWAGPEAPVAIVPTAEPDGFAVFLPDGLIRVMRLPPQ